MAVTSNGATDLNYEVFEADGPTLLLVNGLGSQMISFFPEFCDVFVERGYQVVRFDNRDVGLSSKTPPPAPSVADVIAARAAGEPVDVPYTLSDMAADAMAVLDAVGVDQAHIWGMSMGGMIVQQIAADHPNRVLSMTSVMSSTGDHKVGRSTPEAMAVLTDVAPLERDGAIEHHLRGRRVTAGSMFDDTDVRRLITEAFDRCNHPVGLAFQMAAVTASGDRTEMISKLDLPVQVIHGGLDPLIDASGGVATADAIPGAELIVYEEMGHDIPRPLWTAYADDFDRLVERSLSA
ncbi:MAG: pimeloyl-ACP methyl ester carboxylesterase [Candidatus Poriferisodalaceae bacterium]|jgi:pimeloyl-ACP methyl ester carboxylesterase